MKKFIITLLMTICSVCAYGQEYKLYKTQNIHNQLRLNTCTGAVTQIQDDGQRWDFVDDIEPEGEWTNRFRLYETENIWTFIELDTFTGRLWQVQFSARSTENMFAIPINLTKLAYSENKSIFTISPMTSMYQFYLMNNSNGKMWKFQWSQKGDDYRWIEPM